MRGSLSKLPTLLSPGRALREPPFLSYFLASSPVHFCTKEPMGRQRAAEGSPSRLSHHIAHGTAALNRGQTLVTQPRSP